MIDSFTVTILLILVSTVFASFIKGRSKDKCLKDFNGYIIQLNFDSLSVYGRLVVESGGLEIQYLQDHLDSDGHRETSFIVYKNEFELIRSIYRPHANFDLSQKKKRGKIHQNIYSPTFFSNLNRSFKNFFKTVKDTILEIFSISISQLQKSPATGRYMTHGSKYINKMQQDLNSTMTSSYEPILERYIGSKVVVEQAIADSKPVEYSGILKDYSATFIQLLDVELKPEVKSKSGKLTKSQKSAIFSTNDILFQRNSAVVRHAGA